MRKITCFDTAALSQTVQRVRLHGRGTAAHDPAAVGLVVGRVRALDHPCHVTVALGAFPDQRQVAAVDGTAEVGDGHFTTAVGASDVGQQALADVGGNGLPTLAS
jgi:hypothetical protein